MPDERFDRRAFLSASCSAFAAAWLAADPNAVRASLLHAARARLGRGPWEYLSPEQAADADAITAQIIPTDDTPGAREAGVVHFFDHSLATWAQDQREPFTGGLDDLNREVASRWPGTARFAQLPPEHQVELLHAVEQAPFFQMMRFVTIAGTFANPSWGGNQNKVGWTLLEFEDRYVWEPPFGDYDADAAAGH